MAIYFPQFLHRKMKNKIFIPSEMCFCGNLFINNKFLCGKRDFPSTQVSPKRLNRSPFSHFPGK